MTSSARTSLCAGAIALALLVVGDSGCRVFSSVEDCTTDTDCSGNERCEPSGHFCERLTAIHVGVTLGLTGSVAGVGATMKDALDFAVSTVNAEGGVLGVPLVLDVLDDQSDEDVGAANAKQLVDKGVVAVIGPLRSAQVLKAQAVTYPARVLHLSPVGGAGALARSQPSHDRYLFQTIASIRKGSASSIVRFASKPVDDPPRAQPACTDMAVLHTDDLTGTEYRDAIASLLPKHGGCVTLDVSFPATLKADYADEIGKLVAKKPQCAALIALPAIGAAIMREHAKQTKADTGTDWSKFYWLGTTTLHVQDFLVGAREDKAKPTPTFAEGFLGADVDAAPPTAEYADFKFAYNGAYGVDPPNLSAQGFDALILVALAVEKAKTAHDRVKIRDAIYDVTRDGDRITAFGPGTVGDALRTVRRGIAINYQGASGGIEMDDEGVVVDPTLIWSVVDGAFTQVLRYSEAQTGAIDSIKDPRTCP